VGWLLTVNVVFPLGYDKKLHTTFSGSGLKATAKVEEFLDRLSYRLNPTVYETLGNDLEFPDRRAPYHVRKSAYDAALEALEADLFDCLPTSFGSRADCPGCVGDCLVQSLGVHPFDAWNRDAKTGATKPFVPCLSEVFAKLPTFKIRTVIYVSSFLLVILISVFHVDVRFNTL
jgi:hypothetical protein